MLVDSYNVVVVEVAVVGVDVAEVDDVAVVAAGDSSGCAVVGCRRGDIGKFCGVVLGRRVA